MGALSSVAEVVMRPELALLLARHGLPTWLAPDYATMVGIAGVLGAWLVLGLAERDRADVRVQARALLLAYVAALLGGYVFEWLRAVPDAIATRSVDPIVFAGRAAYGGLIFGLVTPAIYLRRKEQSIAAFLDRATIAMGIAYGAVRTGCFLEGCDYGRPTSSIVGVRFPAGSLAADAHAAHGWVPAGAPSLPVHPTELYEAGVGLLATAIAFVWLRRGRRDGAAITAWLATYAVGRFLLELLRGDVERGLYATLSTAQWVSLAILAGIVVLRTRSRAVVAIAAATAILVLPRAAHAQGETPAPAPSTIVVLPPGSPPPAATTTTTAPPAPPPPDAKPEDERPNRIVTARIALAASVTVARPDVPSGVAGELDVMYRLRLQSRSRLDIGLEGREYSNAEARHHSLGVIGEFVYEASRHFELTFTLVPHHTWFVFDSPYFTSTNAYGLRYALGFQFTSSDRVAFGLTPLALTTTSSETVGVITQWEPRLWLSVLF
jgi:prolipoprotein diacylglyceryltransferase